MFDLFKNFFGNHTTTARDEYNRSLLLSEKALNDAEFRNGESTIYFSETHYNYLLNTFNITERSVHNEQKVSGSELAINGSIDICNTAKMGTNLECSKSHLTQDTYEKDSKISTILNNIDSIKKQGKTILDVQNAGEFFYVHFPVFHGQLINFNTLIENVYIWSGKYRNVELYMCGSSKNVYFSGIDKESIAKWNPSGIEGPQNIFETIVTSLEDSDDEYKEIFNKYDIFKILRENIKDTVMNRNGLGKSFYQWQDLLVLCAGVEEDNGIKTVFGVPVLVKSSQKYGYGWYNLRHIDKTTYHPNKVDSYYEFNGVDFTGRFLSKTKDLYGKFNKNIDVIDGNIAYKLYEYEIKNDDPQTIKKDYVRKCDDIIAICIEKEL